MRIKFCKSLLGWNSYCIHSIKYNCVFLKYTSALMSPQFASSAPLQIHLSFARQIYIYIYIQTEANLFGPQQKSDFSLRFRITGNMEITRLPSSPYNFRFLCALTYKSGYRKNTNQINIYPTKYGISSYATIGRGIEGGASY